MTKRRHLKRWSSSEIYGTYYPRVVVERYQEGSNVVLEIAYEKEPNVFEVMRITDKVESSSCVFVTMMRALLSTVDFQEFLQTQNEERRAKRSARKS